MRLYDVGRAHGAGLPELRADDVQKVRPRPDEAVLHQRKVPGLLPEDKRGYKRRMPKATTDTVENAEEIAPAAEEAEKKPAKTAKTTKTGKTAKAAKAAKTAKTTKKAAEKKPAARKKTKTESEA